MLTVDGEQLFGMVSRDSSGEWLLLDREGRTTRIPEDDIEDMADSDLSSMPDGLLDSLSLDEITHLFAYLMEQDNLSTAESSFQPCASTLVGDVTTNSITARPHPHGPDRWPRRRGNHRAGQSFADSRTIPFQAGRALP